MSGSVYVVLAIDTEGPTCHSDRPDLLSTWAGVDRFVGRLFEPEYRWQVRDTDGHGLAVSWFMLTWTGFRTNPAGRAFGYHKIHDHYRTRWGARMRQWGDGVYWHYHHPAASGVATEWTNDWSASQEYLQILNRLVIDRGFFPSVFRAGGAIETNAMSDWLERWIPIDYSNRAGNINWDALDENGRRIRDLNDWSRAPSDWTIYHPAADDYQRPGDMHRVILRCPDLSNWIYSLTDNDVGLAFERAEQGQDTVMATFDHDYRERSDLFVEALMQRVARAARRHPHVRWRYANALDAAQRVLGWESREGPAFVMHPGQDEASWEITTNGMLFGSAPYVACRFDDTGAYVDLNVDSCGDRHWRLPVGDRSRPRRIGIAASDRFGNVGVSRYRWDGASLEAELARPGCGEDETLQRGETVSDGIRPSQALPLP